MGRPKMDNPKNKQLRIRLTEYEYMVLKELADLRGISMAALLRKEIDRPWKEIEKELTEEQKAAFIDKTIRLAKDILLKEDCK